MMVKHDELSNGHRLIEGRYNKLAPALQWSNARGSYGTGATRPHAYCGVLKAARTRLVPPFFTIFLLAVSGSESAAGGIIYIAARGAQPCMYLVYVLRFYILRPSAPCFCERQGERKRGFRVAYTKYISFRSHVPASKKKTPHYDTHYPAVIARSSPSIWHLFMN